MKKSLLSVILALVLAAGSITAVSAVEKDEAENTYSEMSENEKNEFINENLTDRYKHLSRLAIISSDMAYDKLEDEIKEALSDGLTAVEIKETIYHSGAYCGFTRAAKALDKADEILASLGEDISYKSRITKEEKSRYDDGLSVQRLLFGPQIGTVTEDMEDSLKLQTVFLSGICFGDFYNRAGLPLYDREFITLCTISGNGNCAGQLGGHVTGNLNVGHSKDMLRAAMLYNEDINGSEKTELALSVIDSSETELNNNPTPERPQPTETIQTEYKSDSEEILSFTEHFKADDKDGYVDKNIDSDTQKLLISATEAVIEGTAIPTSDDKAVQVLIDLAVMDAQGGREDELEEKAAEGIKAGLKPENMLAVPLLTAAYNGFPRTLNFRGALAAIDTDSLSDENKENIVIKLQIGNTKASVNGSDKTLEKAPVLTDGKTYAPESALSEITGKTGGDMVPVRETAEALGYTVIWSQPTQTATVIKADKIENVFPKGELNPAAPMFTGVSYMNWLTSYDEDGMKIPAFGQVTFEPCTRTDWHYHDGGQILLVTEGVGVFQMEGEAPRLMQAGDVILIPPGKKHMHSAIDDSWFAHIAIGVNPGVGTTNWLGKVTDEEYAAAVSAARENGVIREKADTMFPKGESFSGEGYSGEIYKNVLVENESTYNCPEVDYFTFSPSARTAWHSHEYGQLIIVTDGTGVYQEEGSSPKIIKAGDVIESTPGINHWHGAADESFSYISVNANSGEIVWGDEVSDSEYSAATGNTALNTVVNTKYGLIKGNENNGILNFLGVPYAKADEMFVRAKELTPWEGELDATSYGDTSPQGAIMGGTAIDSGEGTSNNCQNLNIWTPGADNKKRAVMVWLHGGGFSTGSANEDNFVGENLSKNQDVVVVGVNHRLNVLGHLDLSAYGDKYKFSENIGIFDIVDALKWINENIESFGGDPENVTIFGESGGGAKVLALMTSPYAKGLFDKGIVESGATEGMGVYFTKKEISADLGALTLEKLGLTPETVEDIQKMSIADIQKASDEAKAEIAEKYKVPVSIGEGYAYEWEPVVDGDFLPTDPVTEEGFADAGKDIPLLIGSNLNEWSMWIPTETHNDMTEEEREEYTKAYPNEDPETAIYVDTLIRKPMLKIMSHKADQDGADVYAYIFTKQIEDMGSYHGAEIPFVFDNTDDPLADTMSEAWASFAKTGKPSAKNLPQWKPYTRENMSTMILDDTSYLARNHDKKLISLLEPEIIHIKKP